MVRRLCLFILAITAAAFLAPTPAIGQTTPTGNKCSPTSATGRGISSTRLASVGSKTISLDEVRFEGDTKLTKEELDAAAADLIRESGSLPREKYLEIANLASRPWADRGYFRVAITQKVEQLSHDPMSEHYGVVLHVDAGQIYRTGMIRLKNVEGGALAISSEELRRLIPLQPGDIFATSKLREGFEALKKRYSEAGYIDMVSEPSFAINENPGVVNLTLRLDQQKQFRIGSYELLGLDEALDSELRSIVALGEPFNEVELRNFIQENCERFASPAGRLDMEVHPDREQATVVLVFRYQTCEEAKN